MHFRCAVIYHLEIWYVDKSMLFENNQKQFPFWLKRNNIKNISLKNFENHKNFNENIFTQFCKVSNFYLNYIFRKMCQIIRKHILWKRQRTISTLRECLIYSIYIYIFKTFTNYVCMELSQSIQYFRPMKLKIWAIIYSMCPLNYFQLNSII